MGRTRRDFLKTRVAASAAGKESLLIVVMFVLLDSRGITA
jgi:hypothetical protein